MYTMHHLLVPIDYSERAYRAYERAVQLARFHGATVHVLRVIVRQTLSLGEMLQNLSFTEVDVAEQLHLSAARYARAGNGSPREESVPVVHAEQHAASISAGILSYAEARNIDLIVLGIPGPEDGSDQIRQEPVAERVIRQAPCPVFTVRTGVRFQPGQSIRRILVPVDVTQNAPPLVAYARALAETCAAELALLHVLEEPRVPLVYNTDRFRAAIPQQVSEAQQTLQALAREGKGPEVPVRCHVLAGQPAQVILDFAEARDIDLILMAPHSRSGLHYLLLGSVTERVIREASCLVGTVKPSAQTADAGWLYEAHGQTMV